MTVSDGPDPAGDAATDPRACPYPDYEAVGEASGSVPATGEGADGLDADVWDELYDVEDPEMPVSIVDLGLIYGVTLEDGHATVDMTLTYTGCPAREMLLGNVEDAVASVDGVEAVSVRLVWSPGWTVDMITDDGAQDLREFGLSV